MPSQRRIGSSPVNPDGDAPGVLPGFAAEERGPAQPVAAQGDEDPRLVVRLAVAVLAADRDVLHVGVAQRAEELVLVEPEPADAQHQEGARLGDHAEVDLEAGVAEVVPGIGVERAADAAEDAHGVVVELLRAARRRGARAARSPAGACRAGDDSGSKSPPSRHVRLIPAPGSPGGARFLRVYRHVVQALPLSHARSLIRARLPSVSRRRQSACSTGWSTRCCRPPASAADGRSRRGGAPLGLCAACRAASRPCRGKPARSAPGRSPPMPCRRTTGAAPAGRARPPSTGCSRSGATGRRSTPWCAGSSSGVWTISAGTWRRRSPRR